MRLKARELREPDRLGQELVDRGLVRTEDLVEAIRALKPGGVPLREALVVKGLVSAQDMLATIGDALHLPVVDLKRQSIDPTLLKYVPEVLARRYCAIPVEMRDGALLVAIADPENLQAVEELQAQANVRVEAALADPGQIMDAVSRSYRATSEIAEHVTQFEDQAQSAVAGIQTAETGDKAPIVRTLDLLLLQAVRDGASDIHVEPQENRLRVRYRIDGVLKDVLTLPKSVHASLVSRVKILAQMNIAERRLPQDGQFTFKSEGKEIGFRVATVETAFGERAVLRVLDKATSLRSLPDLGFPPEALAKYQEMLRVPHGMILVSGPTGSGKTTTLYSSINVLDRQRTNIVTIEDPIEYRFTDINQIPVNPKAGLTFGAGLRALMRHDPDVILVGEIRDSDTAQTAIQAALTGHLVLSSIHANDTEGVLHRLANLGVDPFLMASALTGVVAQRMVRRVCPDCTETRAPQPEEIFAYEREELPLPTKISQGAGCQFCANTGYRGRTGIYEVMVMTEELRRLALSSAVPGAVKKEAVKEGMISLLRDGLTKASQGITTPMEAVRNLYA